MKSSGVLKILLMIKPTNGLPGVVDRSHPVIDMSFPVVVVIMYGGLPGQLGGE